MNTTDEQQHSQKVIAGLKQKIKNAQGPITFAEFMQFALYEPGLGYYVSGSHKLGAGGDFTTAPLISPLFSACLANYYAKIHPKQILELGAGTGDMAIGILKRLADLNDLPENYFILEISPDLQQRQKQHLAAHLPGNIYSRIQWLKRLPESIHGAIIANEVIDAMPIERVQLQNKRWMQQTIRVDGASFVEAYQVIQTPALQDAVNQLPIHLPDGYLTEVNTWITPWIKSLASCLKVGTITLIDYGFLRDEYYHPQRHMGTLTCHFRHQANNNPLQNIGLQDITAHVDFTTVGESAEACGLNVTEFCNQAQFLVDCGITELLREITDRSTYEKHLPGIHQLRSPNEMGELFKVMNLTKHAIMPPTR
jgi:SAM-dependent MidA family methyltransferase